MYYLLVHLQMRAIYSEQHTVSVTYATADITV